MDIVGNTKKQILQEISKSPIHGYKLALSLNIPLSTVYGHLRDMKEMGLIKSQANSRQFVYEPTEKGKLLLEILK